MMELRTDLIGKTRRLKKINKQDAIEVLEALILDPDESTTPHCVEEYNAGVQNAITVIQENF